VNAARAARRRAKGMEAEVVDRSVRWRYGTKYLGSHQHGSGYVSGRQIEVEKEDVEEGTYFVGGRMGKGGSEGMK